MPWNINQLKAQEEPKPVVTDHKTGKTFRVVVDVEVIRDDNGNIARDEHGEARVIDKHTGEEVTDNNIREK